MVFWRSKIAKPADARVETPEPAESGGPATAGPDTATEESLASALVIAESETARPEPVDEAEPTNVVALSSNRLTDRLVATITKDTNETALTPATAVARKAAVKDISLGAKALKQALSAPIDDGHVLVIAPADGSRMPAIIESAKACAGEWPAPTAWVTATVDMGSAKTPVFAVPRAEAAALISDANLALKSAAAHLTRVAKSDDYKMSLDVLAEEHMHASEQPLELLKRRAEAQNIAVVKTLDGFVLAPMHDGRVVRQDVFRALPSSLQRDVESKISVLEAELQSLIAIAPEAALANETKLYALFANVVSQSMQAPFARLQSKHADRHEAGLLFSYLEKAFLNCGSDWLLRGANDGFRSGQVFCLSAGDATSASTAAPVVIARDLSPAKLMGEIGHDGHGGLALAGGKLADANGGFLVIEAWRLAADPQGWLALSAAIEANEIVPLSRTGLIAAFDAVPLAVRVVLVADEASFKKLEALDPGISRHFPTVVRLSLQDGPA